MVQGDGGRQSRGQRPYLGNRVRIGIAPMDIETLPEEIVQVAPATTSCVKNPHPRHDPAAQNLVEVIDVDWTTQVEQIRHGVHQGCEGPPRVACMRIHATDGAPLPLCFSRASCRNTRVTPTSLTRSLHE